MVGFHRPPAFHVAHHRRAPRAVGIGEPALRRLQRARTRRIAFARQDLEVRGKGTLSRLLAARCRHDLLHVAAEQAGDGREHAEHHQLLPHPQQHIVGMLPLDGALCEHVGQRQGPARRLAIPLAKDDALEGAGVADGAVGEQHRVDGATAAQHVGAAEAAVEPFEVREAVQQRQHRRGAAHRRRNRVHRRVEVVGLAGEQDQVVARAQFAGHHGVHRQRQVAERTGDAQAVAGDLLMTSGADEERDVGSRVRQPPTEVAADPASAEHQDLHGRHPPMVRHEITIG